VSAPNPEDGIGARLPFPGPRPFRQEEAYLFFGRTGQARETRSHWLSDRVIVLSGPIAVGKTSLLRAGVLPAIRSTDADILPVGRITPRVPGSRQRDAANYTEELLRSWKGDGRQPPRNTTVREFIEERRGTLGGRGQLGPTLACIDQLEELYAEPLGIVTVEQFLDELSAAVEALPDLHLLLLVRQDMVRVLASHKRLSELRPRYIQLRPFDAAAALEAIVKPAFTSAVSFASGTAERLVKDLQTVTFCDIVDNTATVHRDEIEPLHLQIACRDLWASLPANADVITGKRLQAWGGVDKAMIDFYDAAAVEIATDTETGEGRLRDWLRVTFVTEFGTRDSVRSGSLALAGMPAVVVAALVDRRILSAEVRDDDTWYQLSHDRLAYAVIAANRTYHRAHGTERVGQPDVLRDSDTLQAAADAALRAGDLVAAERSIAEALDMFQTAGNWRRMGDARVLQADIARARGDLAAAEYRLREALTIFFMLDDRYAAAQALSALAELHFIAGDYAQAAELSRLAVERMPGDVTALTGLAYAQWQGGSPADAEATFGQALRWDSDTALALAGRGQVRADLGQYERALDDLDRALQHDLPPEAEADARSARALALAGVGRVGESEAELETAVQLAPDRPRSRLRAGRIAAILGHRDEVRGEIERALSGRPTLSSVERESARRILENLR
jgi:tetratricopeptide (TPR) repeat protein